MKTINMRRFLRLTLLAIVLIQVSTVSSVFASQLVVIDLQYLYTDSDAGKSVAQHLDGQKAKLQSLVSSWEAQLKTEEEQLRGQQALLEPKIFREKRRQFEAKAVQVRRNVDAINRKIGELRDLGRREIAKVIRMVLEEMSSAKGYTMAIDKSIPLFVAPSADLTAEVLQQLNSRLNTVALPDITITETPVPTGATQ